MVVNTPEVREPTTHDGSSRIRSLMRTSPSSVSRADGAHHWELLQQIEAEQHTENLLSRLLPNYESRP